MSDPLQNVVILAQAGGVAAPAPAAAAQPAATAAPAPAAEHTAAGTAHATEKEVFPPFDTTFFPSTLLWLAITFIALYFVIWKVAIPRISAILENRQGRIEGDIKAAEQMKAQAEAAATGYEKSLAEARAGGAKIAEAARSKARGAADAKRAQIEASLNAKLAASEAEIGKIKTQALGEVGTVARDAAAAIVKALTGMDASPREVGEAVDKSMA